MGEKLSFCHKPHLAHSLALESLEELGKLGSYCSVDTGSSSLCECMCSRGHREWELLSR